MKVLLLCLSRVIENSKLRSYQVENVCDYETKREFNL